ncbi:tetratricopeptide repeat protein, partial [Oceanospirillum sp. HFRX-1_2]
IMSVGTEAGAPIPLGDQGFVKDQKGNVIISQLDRIELEDFAASTDALIHSITLDEEDLDYLLPVDVDQQEIKETQARLPLWIEQGHWFLLPVLPLVALAFRRNWLLMLPLLILLSAPKPVFAFWPANPQSEGEAAFQEGNYDQAEELLKDPLWRGSAYYRQKDYQQAISEFAKSDTPQAHYNRGNALARLGRLDEAMSAYSKALEQNPNLKDAEFNRSLVEKLLKQQQDQQQNREQQHQSNNDPNPQSSEPQSPEKGSSEQQSSDQPSSEQQGQSEQSPQNGQSGQNGSQQSVPEQQGSENLSDTAPNQSADSQNQEFGP